MRLVPFSTNSYTEDTHFIIESDDYERVSKYKWRLQIRSSGRGVKKYNTYLVSRSASSLERDSGSPHTISLHRFILNIHNRYSNPNEEVDHINRNTLDNRRSNLRLVTRDQNQRNKHNNTLVGEGLWGASFNKSYKTDRKWQSNIHVKGKTYMAGTYTTEIEAHEAAKDKYLQITGKVKQ